MPTRRQDTESDRPLDTGGAAQFEKLQRASAERRRGPSDLEVEAMLSGDSSGFVERFRQPPGE